MTEKEKESDKIKLYYDTDSSDVHGCGYEVAKAEAMIMVAERLEVTNEILLAMLKKIESVL